MRPPLSAGGQRSSSRRSSGPMTTANDVADRVEGAEPDPPCEDEVSAAGVGPEAVPVPEVHGAAEREAEREAECRERPARSRSDRRRGRRRRRNRPRQASATVSRCPGPGRSSRPARRLRRPRSRRAAPSAPAATATTVTGCTPGTAAKQHSPGRGGTTEDSDERDLLRRPFRPPAIRTRRARVPRLRAGARGRRPAAKAPSTPRRRKRPRRKRAARTWHGPAPVPGRW